MGEFIRSHKIALVLGGVVLALLVYVYFRTRQQNAEDAAAANQNSTAVNPDQGVVIEFLPAPTPGVQPVPTSSPPIPVPGMPVGPTGPAQPVSGGGVGGGPIKPIAPIGGKKPPVPVPHPSPFHRSPPVPVHPRGPVGLASPTPRHIANSYGSWAPAPAPNGRGGFRQN